MFTGSKLLEDERIDSIESIREDLEALAPSIAEMIIEEAKGNEAHYVPANYIQYIYIVGKFNIIIDYDNNIFIDEEIEVVDLTAKMEL